MKNLTFITGAVRSGKSTFAEKLAAASKDKVLYIATMPELKGDAEQSKRIALHQTRRPSNWTTVEESYHLPSLIASISSEYGLVICDCLSVYVSNVLLAAMKFQTEDDPYAHEEHVFTQVDKVLAELELQKQIQFIVVSNEVGWGVVPETPLGRAFRDFVGLSNQKFAAQAHEVFLTCAGLPMRLKPQPQAF